MVCVPNLKKKVLGMLEACFQHDIVWLMSQSDLHKQFFISDLEWVMPKACYQAS